MSPFLDISFSILVKLKEVKQMLDRVRQAYDYYVRAALGEKGQDMVEYALMLAIIVGIGWLIYQQGDLEQEVSNVFSQSQLLIQTAANHKD